MVSDTLGEEYQKGHERTGLEGQGAWVYGQPASDRRRDGRQRLKSGLGVWAKGKSSGFWSKEATDQLAGREDSYQGCGRFQQEPVPRMRAAFFSSALMCSSR